MNFEELINQEYEILDEAAMPLAQKQAVTRLTKSGWEITDKGNDAVTVSKSGNTMRIKKDGKSFIVNEDAEVDISEIAEDLDSINIDELKEALFSDIEVVEEGIGGSLARGLSALFGMSVGAGIAGNVSASILLAAAGFINPAALGVWGLGAVAGASVLGGAGGASLGYSAGKKLTGMTAFEQTQKLKRTVEERDELIKQAEQSSDSEDFLKRNARRIKSLTKAQQSIAKNIEKLAKKEFKAGNLTKKQHDEFYALALSAKEGKLSELSNKRA